MKTTMPANRLILEIALQNYGLVEVAGKASNPLLLKIIIKYMPSAKDDSTVSWCGIFIRYVIEQLPGGNMLVPPGSLAARNWLKAGAPVAPEDATLGDIVVLWRGDPSGWQGHVGIFIRHAPGYVYLLGGNQSNSVSILKYPVSQILGYRRIYY